MRVWFIGELSRIVAAKDVGKSHELDMEFTFPENIYAAVAGAEQKADRWKVSPQLWLVLSLVYQSPRPWQWLIHPRLSRLPLASMEDRLWRFG